MKKCSIRFIAGLGLSLCLQAALAQEAPTSIQKFYVLNARVKLQLREFAFNLTPFIKSAPWLSIGTGYRFDSKFYRGLDCVFGETMRLRGSLKGPIIMTGFDSKNWGEMRPINYSIIAGYKRLNGGRVEYIEKGCFGGAASESDYKLYDATANEIFFKCLFDFQGRKQQWLNFYAGFGGGFQAVRKAFIKSGTLERIYNDDDIENILYFVPLLDLGVRINMIGIKARG